MTQMYESNFEGFKCKLVGKKFNFQRGKKGDQMTFKLKQFDWLKNVTYLNDVQCDLLKTVMCLEASNLRRVLCLSI